MNELLDQNYIHAIGECNDEETYKRLVSILDNKAIYSRKKLDELGIEHSGANKYGLDIPKGKEWMYYDEDIHHDVISMHNPSNHLIRSIINKNKIFGCFRPSKIALAISREVEILPISETKGIDIGEVQVKGKISTEFISGIIVPNVEMLGVEVQQLLCEKLNQICDSKDYKIAIYDYQGNKIYEVKDKKTL